MQTRKPSETPELTLQDALRELGRMASLSDEEMEAACESDGVSQASPPGAEARVVAAEARFQALVEQIPAVTFSASFDSGLKEIYVSPQIQDVMGYTQQEWLDSPVLWYERLHPDDKPRWNREFGTTVAHGTDFKAVYRFLSKDGRVVWLHGEARIVRDATRRPLCLQGVGFDVTNAFEAQARVRDAETRAKAQLQQQVAARTRELAAYQHLVDSSIDAIASLQRDGTLERWNARAAELFGLADEDSGKTRLPALFANLPRVAEALEQAIASGCSCTLDTEWQSRQGKRLDLSLSISPVFDDEHLLRGMSAIVRDETKYRRAARRFELVVEAAPSAMIMVDGDGHVTLVNGEAERLFGYSRAELVGQPIGILVPESVRAKHPQLRAAFAAAPRSRAMGQGRHLRACRKDGSEFPVEIGLNPIETTEGLLVLCAVVDISERKRSEQALFAANAALQAKSAEMEQFVYTVSHDLKSPLVTMGAFLDILREDLTNGNAEGAADAMQRVRNSVARMHALIDDLLELSRVGSVEIQSSPVDLSALLDSVVETYAKQLADSGLRVVRAHPLPIVRADPDQLFQVFDNLLSNAIKYATASPCPQLVVSSQRRHGEVCIKLSDNGPGIPAQHRQRVFKLFHRLQPRRGTGTGVGLAIVSRVMLAHGGRAWVEASDPHGACFVLAFPASACLAVAPHYED